jgi:hypothetical protein
MIRDSIGHPMVQLSRAIAFVILFQAGLLWADGINVRELKLTGDGKTDDTVSLQAALDSGTCNLYFPPGEYVLGPVKLPTNTRLVFDSNAKLKPNPDKINYMKEIEENGKTKKVSAKKPLFTISGEYIHLTSLRYDFSTGATEKDPVPVTTLVYADKSSQVVISDFHITRSGKAKLQNNVKLTLLEALDCDNVVMENSGAENITHMVWTTQCSNVTVRGNWMISGAALTTFTFGSESLRHYDNWSRNVGYQCVWRGGSPDPSRKAPKVPLGTANVVHRGSRPSDPDFIPHTQGVFDVQVKSNYSEYGTVLCWGNKGRQILVDGNISRFMSDYSYGSEGDENVIYSNNISINSAVGGFTCLYWGEKILITGNMVIVRHEPFRPELADRPEPVYMGQFIRLHHGPPDPEDKYGTGSVNITGNLFVNELADRPSGISIEAGRDVMLSNNKIINGLVRKSDEFAHIKPEDAKKDADEFASQKIAQTGKNETVTIKRLVGTDMSRVTVIGNEFISRQNGDKPMMLINGTVSVAIIKNNVFRKEQTHLKFTDAEKEMEKTPPRYMLYSQDSLQPDYTNASPATAIGIAPFSANFSVVQDNFIYGWKDAIKADNTVDKGKVSFVVTGNTTDGDISVTGEPDRTFKKVEGNIKIPKELIP